jgi:hypothetical protein
VRKLHVKDSMTLDLERRHWKYAGAKDAHIRTIFGESSTIYYARLNRLLDDPAALAYAPLVVKRLLRLREARRQVRSVPSRAPAS